jgi:glycosyltransferase involved in cell wall biosynthesis
MLDIVMPFYGRIDHFREAVESVRNQSDPDWHLLVIDDHYPDESAGAWLLSLGDDRVDYVRNETNLGINANFQASIDQSAGEWVTIFGCDDVMLPNYVARVKALVREHGTATFIQPGVRVIDEAGAECKPLVDRAKDFYRPRFRGSLLLSGERLATSLVRADWMYFPALCWRRDALVRHGFRKDLHTAQDIALAIDLILDGAVLAVDDTVAFEYRRHQASVSSARAVNGARFLEEQEFFLRVAAEFRTRGWTRASRAARLHVSSRINALVSLPAALGARDSHGAATLLRYGIGREPTGCTKSRTTS